MKDRIQNLATILQFGLAALHLPLVALTPAGSEIPDLIAMGVFGLLGFGLHLRMRAVAWLAYFSMLVELSISLANAMLSSGVFVMLNLAILSACMVQTCVLFLLLWGRNYARRSEA